MNPGIEVADLASRYGDETVFEHLSLTIAGGAFTALLGPSGVGKTTLLKMLAGLEAPAAGAITAADGKALAGRIAYMAQQDLLLPWADALDNIMLGATLRGEAKDAGRAKRILQQVGLGGQGKKRPSQLSGGMRARVALARTLYEDRPIVLMDEPFSALDAMTRLAMQTLAATLLGGRTVLFITHDPQEACRLGHHMFVLAGSPARLGPATTLPGAPPRAADDPQLLAAQARLLRQLAGAA